jgi:hypothetical protein
LAVEQFDASAGLGETSAFLAYFRSNAAEFLCSSDWLAEGGEFELSIL